MEEALRWAKTIAEGAQERERAAARRLEDRDRELASANKQLALRDVDLQQCRNALLHADRHAARSAGDLRQVTVEIASFQAEIAALASKVREFDAVRQSLQERETELVEKSSQIAQLNEVTGAAHQRLLQAESELDASRAECAGLRYEHQKSLHTRASCNAKETYY